MAINTFARKVITGYIPIFIPYGMMVDRDFRRREEIFIPFGVKM
jgi:hypothetical protein